MLSRRGSSQTTLVLRNSREIAFGTLKLRALSDAHSSAVSKVTPRLPLELLEYVVGCYFDDFAPGSLRLIHDHVKAIRLCNHAFNEIALRHVFKTAIITTAAIWNAIVRALLRKTEEGACKGRNFGFAWVRQLVVERVYNILRTPEHLLHFSRLQSLTLDFGTEGLHTQYDCVQKLFNVLSSSVALPSTVSGNDRTAVSDYISAGSGLRQSLKRLMFAKLPCINQQLLQNIACTFPNLVSLELESTSRLNLYCCSECYEDSLTLTMHSLVARKYRCAEDLALTFGEALQPLTSLKSLYLGIFLSPEELIENHVAHTQNTRRARTIGTLPDIQPATIPNCTRCQTSKLLQQYSLENMQHQELVASLRVAQFVKSLEVIAWDSICSIQGHGSDLGSAAPRQDAIPTVQQVNESRASGDDHPEWSDSQESAGTSANSSPDLSADEDEETYEVTIRRNFKVRMRITREAGRVRVERFDPLPRGQAAFSGSEM